MTCNLSTSRFLIKEYNIIHALNLIYCACIYVCPRERERIEAESAPFEVSLRFLHQWLPTACVIQSSIIIVLFFNVILYLSHDLKNRNEITSYRKRALDKNIAYRHDTVEINFVRFATKTSLYCYLKRNAYVHFKQITFSCFINRFLFYLSFNAL